MYVALKCECPQGAMVPKIRCCDEDYCMLNTESVVLRNKIWNHTVTSSCKSKDLEKSPSYSRIGCYRNTPEFEDFGGTCMSPKYEFVRYDLWVFPGGYVSENTMCNEDYSMLNTDSVVLRNVILNHTVTSSCKSKDLKKSPSYSRIGRYVKERINSRIKIPYIIGWTCQSTVYFNSPKCKNNITQFPQIRCSFSLGPHWLISYFLSVESVPWTHRWTPTTR